MAAIAFDPLEYTRLLEGAGVPRDQAEVHARAMTAAFLHNVDALVTKDYLDSRLNEFEARFEARIEARIDAKLDRRFSEFESRIERRFAEIDQRFTEIDRRFTEIDRRFAAIDVRFERIEGQFGRVYLMLGIIMVATVIPALQHLLGWLG